MGADGLMIPHVDTPEQVRNIVQWSKYYPDGKRSYGMRHTLINQSGNTNKELYIKQANEKITLLIQVESQESIFNLESMLSEPYIDGIIVGPADLSMDIGLIGDYTNEKFVNLVNKTLSICLNKKKGFGIHFSEVALIKTWKMKGMNIILYSNETNLLKESILNALNELKKT
jgi:2-keto-3-deoxy-L-rhamnonate aldolase RhmA